MKGFNLVLAILIFLLAVTSAVFSFFLFEKRNQLVRGHGYMGEKYGEIAQMFDAKSGTTLAAEVNRETLHHDNDQALENLLTSFAATTKNIIKERDDLADSLAKMGSNLGMRGANADSFKHLQSYSDSIKNLENYVASYKARHDAFISSVAAWSGSLNDLIGKKINGTRIDAANLTNNYKKQFDAFGQALKALIDRDKKFVASIGNIVNELKTAPDAPPQSNVDLATSYEADLKTVENFVKKVVSHANDLDTSLKNANSRIKNLVADINNLNNKIEQLKADVERRNQEIIRLNRIMGNEIPRQPVADGSAEALHMIKTQGKGSVLSVSDKFGFIVVSLGTATRVQDQFGNRIDNVDPMIPADAVLTVMRNMPSGEAQYINTVKIVRLDENCSIAESIDKNGGSEIRPGDVVFFSDAEVVRIVESRK